MNWFLVVGLWLLGVVLHYLLLVGMVGLPNSRRDTVLTGLLLCLPFVWVGLWLFLLNLRFNKNVEVDKNGFWKKKERKGGGLFR